MSHQELIYCVNKLTNSIRDYMHSNLISHQYKDQKIENLLSEISSLEEEKVDGTNITEYENKITHLQDKISNLEHEKQEIQKNLYSEMDKADKMQMELDIAERERDMSLKENGITKEQKQSLIRMEHEALKINTVIERIDHVTEALQNILAPKEETIDN